MNKKNREVEMYFQCNGCLQHAGFLSDKNSVETNQRIYNGTNCSCGGKWYFVKQMEKMVRTKEHPLREEL